MLSRLRPRRREENQDSGAQSADFGADVLAYLKTHGIPSAPRYYALVHAALSDRTSLAAHAIAEATDSAPMSHALADAILAAMSGGNVEDAEEHERLRHQTLHLADLAADAAAATNKFGRDLSAGLGDIETDVRSVSAVLSSMIERTRATEERLAAAVEEIEHLRDEVAEARNDAMRDELTGLLNRRGITEHIAGLDPNRPRTVAVCDIDAFKAINDSHGHEVGDRVLKVVAAALADGCAPHLVARWGGEEFLVVLDEPDPARAAEIIDDVRETLGYRALRVRETGESLGKVTFSAGIAAFTPPPFDAALRVADALLYQAKLAGRNRVLAHPPEDRAAA
ncbi:GGDEF domain-containing protein [Sphingomonas sp. LB-2]|uniref:GGDEF domain-containing protein n=1 Tax=Sphingomonas caeni TaxID=2984949 RepID=UPI00223137E3|nr:GGDEF domain-containing protein [Sphingomonas caeni]MCW3848643.1 GGDEF domain-containing protein [Sphingomonas caeni]